MFTMHDVSRDRRKSLVREGIAQFLKQFASSPYKLPGNDYRNVEGTSTLSGSYEKIPEEKSK